MNLYIRELKAHRRSIILWSVAMVLLIFGCMGKYSAGVAAGADNFNKLLSQMPKTLQNLIGVGIFDLSKLVDYFGAVYLYLALMVTIHAVLLGNGIIAKEERDKTAEFLLVKPISRNNIVTAKLLAGVTQVLILNLITWLTILVAFTQFSKEEDYGIPVFHLILGLLGLQLLFLALGAFLAACLKKHKLTASIATGILLVMYLLSVVIDISGKLGFLKVFTYFKYFDSKDILKNGYHYSYIIIACVMVILPIFGAYYFYNKRDMKI